MLCNAMMKHGFYVTMLYAVFADGLALSNIGRGNTIVESEVIKDFRNVICPDEASICPDGSTCCKLASGQYGCCPVPNAVCCNDHVHCCPHGYTCDVGAGTCSKLSTIPLLEKIASESNVIKDVSNTLCPDWVSVCPDGSTCCELASGQYGCCPKPNAVCCDDYVHCCPQGYTCNLGGGGCTKLSTIPLLENIASESNVIKDVSSVICPGGTSTCPDGSTCCILASGQYGCCPVPNAVCCNDHVHCCPQGYTCDVGAGTCSKLSTIPLLEKIASESNVIKDVSNTLCPDWVSVCPDGSTCCELASGQYGCCPKPNAVCCDDYVHCCPQGYTCNLGGGGCTKLSTIPLLENIASESNVIKDVSSVICPGGTAMCPDGSTCCKLASGQYGCCPVPNAVCCNDHVHCCPQGYTCNAGAGTCSKLSTIPLLKKIASESKMIEEVSNTLCPDLVSVCPDGSTCCELASGQYGCCPKPNAVCCDDYVHCCPQGYTCNLGAGGCTKLSTIPLLENIASESKMIKDVSNTLCPDLVSVCPDGSTCCKLASGQYGCCPKPNAVCCDDHVHCCPQGYTCNLGAGGCTKLSTIPLLEKIASESNVIKDVSSVICPGGTAMCPDGSTCCILASGQYGCCPVPNAVCCNDHVHCCPQGYTCNAGAGTCSKLSTIPLLKKIASESNVIKDVSSVICPGGTAMCPDGSTCCKLASGQYGCCPVPNAVCCNDHVHCCPQGYTCNVGAGTCSKLSTIPMLDKIASESNVIKDVLSVICPGGTSMCPDGSTCCKLASGQYGCCPVPNAVCCNDHVHCCPQGYTCDVGAGTCSKLSTIPLLKKIASESNVIKDVSSVICPGGTATCPDGSTCCKLASGQYGCCPVPNAVCCNDHVHCCPHGYTCDVGAGTCSKLSTISLLEKIRATGLGCSFSDKCTMCKDGSECPNFYTCCLMGDGHYGCCKYNQAVCCSDHTHCCPQFTYCDLQKQVCRSQHNEQLLFKMLPTLKAAKVKNENKKLMFTAEENQDTNENIVL